MILARLAVVLALLIAMAGTGFGHRVQSADADQNLQDYLAAGGSYADLCLDTGGRHGVAQTCDACRLVDGFAARDSGASCDPQKLPMDDIQPLRSAMVVASTSVDPSRPVRAPPIV